MQEVRGSIPLISTKSIAGPIGPAFSFPVLSADVCGKPGYPRNSTFVGMEGERMELEQARKRAEELRAVIERNNRLYYDQDAPELEDFEYDQLTREQIGRASCRERV